MICLASSTEVKYFLRSTRTEDYSSIIVCIFGIKCVPAIFHQAMDTMLADLPFAAAYLDGIIIASSNKEDHMSHLISMII